MFILYFLKKTEISEKRINLTLEVTCQLGFKFKTRIFHIKKRILW